MRMFYIFIIIYFTSLLHGCATKKLLKPSFFPYCTTRDKCKPACTCEVQPNCVLLTMDESIRSSILFYHNQIRDIQSAAEPQPAAMTLLQYDMELEEIAICWAARCENEYSECFVTSRFSETSQSVIQLVLADGQQPNVFLWMQVMNDWLGQVRTLSAETIQSIPPGEKGEKLHNYVQLMSDRILAIGCAWSMSGNVLTLVCTYGPRGPLQGESVYKTGYPCSLCPGGYACDYVKPFEQLCKLRIYSAASPQQGTAVQFETPPPPPPLPQLQENSIDDAQYSQPMLIPAPPPLPGNPPVDPSLGQEPPDMGGPIQAPQLPTPPQMLTALPIVSATTIPTTSATVRIVRDDNSEPRQRSSVGKMRIGKTLIALCLFVKIIVLK
ncbi:cysteine-rich secretory protein LCCL domain-containing 2-like [Harmonia axyridis]|uniref:cysteine-rich secretory protein LCCL domain-containing 2-like n=1 Tax=Harmonia axyridis TaxID=115357 RepID=UPI001E2773F9|nr:cysteine-rich secretory protein LCCL domain-containing 2-like [Harmonia axyridis]